MFRFERMNIILYKAAHCSPRTVLVSVICVFRSARGGASGDGNQDVNGKQCLGVGAPVEKALVNFTVHYRSNASS